MLRTQVVSTIVSTCCRQHVSCIGNKIVTSLSPVCCWIQMDTSRPWHKWILIMSPRYEKLYPATQLCPSTYMYPDTSCSSGTHVAGQHVSWCKHGFRPTFQVKLHAWDQPTSAEDSCLFPLLTSSSNLRNRRLSSVVSSSVASWGSSHLLNIWNNFYYSRMNKWMNACISSRKTIFDNHSSVIKAI